MYHQTSAAVDDMINLSAATAAFYRDMICCCWPAEKK
jgi:hypothetical protein